MTNSIINETNDESDALLMNYFKTILLNIIPSTIPIKPYNNMLIKVAPKKVEYLASGPNVSTALDSISPDVSETNAWEAISGTKSPLKEILKISDAANAAMSTARHK